MNIALLSAGYREKALFLPEVRNDFIWAVVGSPWGLLAIWLVFINVITFFVFGADKLQAKRKEKKDTVRRVPEKNLLLLAAAGGSIGALLGMKAFHHKTLHKAFKIGVPVILALQIIIPFGLWLYFAVIR
ncbi:DUF1294 domain-containing protein [uncultured Oscillibacter sp.]|uniref:DUF1294 domain-containing protein n=1 Tax=uncultured Oscillibacter sp. TaxID=876091 RepID=UPI002D810779|nr:DUF1294 domain-containing protein [uncultured Oscillibacter sp.]